MTKLPDGFARFPQRVTDLPPKATKRVAGGVFRRLQLRRDRLELQPDGSKALKKRIVDLATHPRAFGKDERVPAANRSKPQPPGSPEHQREDNGVNGEEPGPPVKRRGDGKLPDGGLGPMAVVGRARTKPVRTGGKIDIRRFTRIARLNPLLVESFEHVPEAQLRRGRQADGSVLHAQG